ncbi:hypothetical protein BDZ89DRAFT_1061708 [Hymenopellis radicata]|nr:hypothetical protein BDZ89DRAFT_1061708 [Hymenopellis radicata]
MAAPENVPAPVNIPQLKIDANPDLFNWYTDDETGGGALWSIGKHAGKRINQLPESYLTWAEENLGGAQVILDYHDQLIKHAKTSPQDFTIPFRNQCPPWYLRSLHSHKDTNPRLQRAIRQLVDPPRAQRQPRPVQIVESSTTSRHSRSTSTTPDQPQAGPSSQALQGKITYDHAHWSFAPIIITSDVVDDNPNYYRWYTDEKQGEFVVPFGPYVNKSVNDLPESYIMELLDQPGELDEELYTALVQYHNGLKQHATQGYEYTEFLVPFGHHYGGRKLSCVRDNQWLEYTNTLELQSKYPAYFLAVERHFQLPNHQEKKRDIGEPLSRSEWDDDMDLRLERAEEERRPGRYEDKDEEEAYDEGVDNEAEEEGDPGLSYAALGQGFRLGRPNYAPSLPRLEGEEECSGSEDSDGDKEGGRKHGDDEDDSEDNESSQESVRSCTRSPSPQRPPFQDQTPGKLHRPSSYEDLVAFELFGSDKGVVSSAAMSVDDVVKSEKDNIVGDENSTFQTPTKPHHQRRATPGASSRLSRRLFPSNEGLIVDRTKSEHEMETIDVSDDEPSVPHTPVRARARHRYNDSDDNEVIYVTSDDEDKPVSRKRRRDTEEPEVETPRKRNKGKGKLKDVSKLLWT